MALAIRVISVPVNAVMIAPYLITNLYPDSHLRDDIYALGAPVRVSRARVEAS